MLGGHQSASSLGDQDVLWIEHPTTTRNRHQQRQQQQPPEEEAGHYRLTKDPTNRHCRLHRYYLNTHLFKT
jgi:hypothetical protein